MQYRPGQVTDFEHIETFVWQAIFPAYDHPDLTEAQRASNDDIVATARKECLKALELPDQHLIVAIDEQRKELAGFIIVDRSPSDYPEIVWLIVSRRNWGTGIASKLLRDGIMWLGTDKAIKLGVIHYNDRAIRFYQKFGFTDSGESAGEHLIPRVLMLREAGPLASLTEKTQELQLEIPLPSSVDSKPNGEELAVQKDQKEPILLEEEPVEIKPKYKIEFEIDYGETPAEATEESTPTSRPFEFAFDELPNTKPVETIEGDTTSELILEELAQPPDQANADSVDLERKTCQECQQALPLEARYCIHCGAAQHQEEQPLKEILEHEPASLIHSGQENETDDSGVAWDAPLMPQFRRRFRGYFAATVTQFFGVKNLLKYENALAASPFRDVVDNALSSLRRWAIERDVSDPLIRITIVNKLTQSMSDLTEYFLVEEAAVIHDNLFPQRLLRHQGKAWENADLFKLVMDYLALGEESERVYTDFITMPAKYLRHATQSFLIAGRDERIFFLLDQSLMGNLKNGFALTDSGLYWKSLLQPNHAVFYRDLAAVVIEKDHLLINGHFFDAGQRLNMKLALLLEKIRRMHA